MKDTQHIPRVQHLDTTKNFQELNNIESESPDESLSTPPEHQHKHSKIKTVVDFFLGNEHQHQHQHLLSDGTVVTHSHSHKHGLLRQRRKKPQEELDADHVHPEIENAASEEAPSEQQLAPWYRRKAFWYFVGRVLMRICAVAILVIIVWKVPIDWGALFDLYINWIKSLGNVLGPVLYTITATVFCGFSPTGYAPSVVAGLTFGYAIGTPISYFIVNAGAIINLLWVRKAQYKLLQIPRLRRCFNERTGRIKGLDILLEKMPFKAVLLIRLPFMANGTMNYVLSLSKVAWRPMLLGNLVGLLPGAIMFSVLGNQVTSLRKIISDKASNKTGLVIFIVICVVTVICVGILLLASRRLIKREGERALAEKAQAQANNAVEMQEVAVAEDTAAASSFNTTEEVTQTESPVPVAASEASHKRLCSL